MKLTLDQIEFCANECARQESGEQSVAAMCRAYVLALSQNLCTMDFIKALAKLIEPKTEGRFRVVPVTKHGGTLIGIPAQQIPQAMDHLAEAILDDRISADRAYMEYERIHPFVDGNGRVGAILYNFLRNRLDDPIVPADLFERIVLENDSF